MTKARTKSQKLANRRRSANAGAGIPDLAPIPKRVKQHRAGGKFARPDVDESIPALQARCRAAGRDRTEADMREMKAQWQGCEAGRAMAGAVADEAVRTVLWDAIQGIRRIVLAYDRALGAPNRHATCLRLMLPPETMEADSSTPPADQRSEDERYRQAVSGWMAMHGWLGHVEASAASVTLRSVVDDQRCTDVGAMIRALHCVSEGMAGRKITYRGVK